MRICQTHWDNLREAIEHRGLMPLVAKDGENAIKMMTAVLEGDTSRTNYDPLMAANFAIWSQCLTAFGLDTLAEDAPCPLCFKTEFESTCMQPDCSKQTGDDWVQFAADDQLKYAQEMGLVPLPS